MNALDQAKRELRLAILADDRLGFDHWTQARRALLTHADYADRWECSPRLLAAIEAYKRARAGQ